MKNDLTQRLMNQAQVFASAWALVGGRFDSGHAIGDAEEAQEDLRGMVQATISGHEHALADKDAEISDLKGDLDHTRQWYAVRLERLWHWAHAKLSDDLKTEYFNIIANGTAGTNDPISYAGQMNALKHRVEFQAAEIAALTKQANAYKTLTESMNRGCLQRPSLPRRCSMDDLLPCPFCRRPPKVIERADNYTDTGRICFIVCMCGGYSACAHKHGDTQAQAVAAWNLRDGKAPAQAVRL